MTDANKPTSSELVVTSRPKSVLIDMADRYGMEPSPFEATVLAICMPANSTREEFAAFLLVAKEYHLNPLTKEIYAFPKRGGGIVPVVSVDGWLSLINSHAACDGFTFSWVQDDKGDPISCTCIMYRKDRAHPIEVTEYLSECYRPTDPWKMKHRMLRHKALIQCARYAFGFSGIYDEDEGAKLAEARDITRPKPPAPPADEPEPEVAAVSESPKDTVVPTGAEFVPTGVIGEAEQAKLDELSAALKAATDEASLEAAFDESDVQTVFVDNDVAIAKAFELKDEAIERMAQGSFVFAGGPPKPPADEPELTHAQKIARTP